MQAPQNDFAAVIREISDMSDRQGDRRRGGIRRAGIRRADSGAQAHATERTNGERGRIL